MSPSATDTVAQLAESVKEKTLPGADDSPKSTNGKNTTTPDDEELPKVRTGHRDPLNPSGALDQFEQFDVTPVIGREFANVDLVEWLRAPNSDELLRDLAITVSQRGVVFFRKQDNVTNDLQKQLLQRLGELSGKPATSKLHIHPVSNASREEGAGDNEISVVTSAGSKKLGTNRFLPYNQRQSQKGQWHSDITFEPVPSDYALLRMAQLPKTGGDTLWASGYEVYDRISRPLQRFLEGLTAQYAQPGFKATAEANGFKLYADVRGAPENVGDVLEAVHPVIRTNPVTGWKSVFAVGHHVHHIHGLSEEESRGFLNWFVQLITENHDLQVRYRWQNENDIAIWDNRSVYHAATPDYIIDDLGERKGSRAVSLGERPYLDPQSTGRREGLATGKTEV